MRAFGMAEFRRGIDVGFAMAEEAEAALRADARWEIVTPAQMGIVTFRWVDASRTDAEVDAMLARVVDRMRVDGYALVMSTMLKGRPALRMVPIHPASQAEEIRETVRRLTRLFEEESAAS
jgi:glutamate/tyrosine decarboxylase-like PLP-dependent enzyme